MQVHGACHCGKVTFTAEIDPAKVMICNCADCQTLSGAPLRAIAQAPIESLKLIGETKSYVKTAESGNKRAQVFCPECATPLYASAVDNPPTVTLRLGCLAERTQLTPGLQLWQQSALPWVSELRAIPGVQAQLPPK
jgi:hypothetical protein